ncbi:hypothetical protein ACFLTE_08310 [Bacteroidota bacterium]
MKYYIFNFKNALILSSLILVQFSCTDDTYLNSTGIEEFAIYKTLNPIAFNPAMNYSNINLDTFELNDNPILTINDIESYDSVNHIINLKKSKDEFDIETSDVYGQMFIVIADDNRIYCGFFWTIISSVICDWIYIEETFLSSKLNDNQIQIQVGYPDSSFFNNTDPRNDSIIINVFSRNGKLTGNSFASGEGFNFYLVKEFPNDTSGFYFKTPINGLELEQEPFIAYEEILIYDTSNHILTMSINYDIIKSRIEDSYKQFVTILNDERQYSGLIIPLTSSRIFNTITIIEPYYEFDSLKSNQIKISLGYPTEDFFDGEDLRLNEDIINRLKLDDKLK